MSFVDIAGLVRGASKGQGRGNKFLANIREASRSARWSARSPTRTWCTSTARSRPADDIETINTELILADLQTLEKALPRLEKEARLHKDRAAGRSPPRRPPASCSTAAPRCTPAPPRPASTSTQLRELHLLTAKPFLYVFNVDEDELANEAFLDELRALVAPAEAVFLDAKIESELIDLPEDEARELLESIGQPEPGLNQLIRVGFRTLGPADVPDGRARRSRGPGRSRSARPPRRRPA